MSKRKKTRARGGTGESRKSMNMPARKAKPGSKKQAVSRDGGQSVRKDTRRPRATIGSTAYRNMRGSDKGESYSLEDSNPEKRPSRKSTRGSSNRIKPDSNLRRRQTRRVRSPQSRSQMRGA